MTAALDNSLQVLACPLCGGHFVRDTAALRCPNNHSFDIAKQGYASLTVGGGPHHRGDTAEMVASREAFLAAGHYAPIADAIAARAPALGWALEIAGGTGYYLARVLDSAPALEGVTLDVSKAAARSAARAHPRLASITADARAALPIATGRIDLVLSVFGPRRGDEIARVLAPGGSVIVVTPRPNHLGELRERFALLAIGADKDARLDEAMAPLAVGERTTLEYTVDLAPEHVANAVMMGPNAFHRDTPPVATGTLATTVAVTITVFRR